MIFLSIEHLLQFWDICNADLIDKSDLRQVPKEVMSQIQQKPSGLQKILLIGRGRLAQHLLYWNSLLNKPNQIVTWNRQQPLDQLKESLQQVEIVWLAISDSAIVSFFEKHLENSPKKCVHFSGALNDSRIFSAHPMMSFPLENFDPPVYSKIYFGLTGTNQLQDIMPGFENSSFQISSEQKALYHALCVVAGNFPQMLWLESENRLNSLNVPSAAFETYIQQCLKNYLNLKDKSLTGPIMRGDQSTMTANQNALSDSKLQSIYQTFAKEFKS